MNVLIYELKLSHDIMELYFHHKSDHPWKQKQLRQSYI